MRLLSLLCLILASTAGASLAAEKPIELGSKRELFVDYHWIDQLKGVELRLHAPVDEGVAIAFDKPWEGRFCGYCTVIKDGPVYRCYYRGRPEAGRDGDIGEVYCYAESEDGIHWTKPELGLYEVLGAKKNNVCLAYAAPVTHNFSPFLDSNPDCAGDKRYKALGGTMESGLKAYVSDDGVYWKPLAEKAVIAKEMVDFPYMFDSQNVSFWSPVEGKYVCYFRVFKDGIRRIARTTSDDFLQWGPPVLMEYRSGEKEAPVEHLYTNQTHPYFRAPHLYVAIAARFMPGRQVLTDEQAQAINVDPKYFRDTSDAIFMTTRGGGVYDRTFLSSFLRGGIGAENWVSRTNYPALNVVPTGPTEMSIYVNQNYAQPTAHLRRYSLRVDGFASAYAPYEGGELLTKPFTFTGDRLSINFSTSAAGGIRFEFQDEQGRAIPGFTLDDCREQIGNEIDRVVTWKGGTDVSALAGKPVRLRIAMKDADLFSLCFEK